MKVKASLGAGLVFFSTGILFWGGFNWSLEATNSEAFCIACHEMKDNLYQEYRQSLHFANRTGVQASCPDCHVPKEWVHKIIRKAHAVNELYHAAIGSIDSREKFIAKRAVLASQVWSSMRKTDSRECRNCHNRSSMRTELQKQNVQVFHSMEKSLNLTCIDCHQGIAHELPENANRQQIMDEVHEVMEEQQVDCVICHEDMPTPAAGDGWD